MWKPASPPAGWIAHSACPRAPRKPLDRREPPLPGKACRWSRPPACLLRPGILCTWPQRPCPRAPKVSRSGERCALPVPRPSTRSSHAANRSRGRCLPAAEPPQLDGHRHRLVASLAPHCSLTSSMPRCATAAAVGLESLRRPWTPLVWPRSALGPPRQRRCPWPPAAASGKALLPPGLAKGPQSAQGLPPRHQAAPWLHSPLPVAFASVPLGLPPSRCSEDLPTPSAGAALAAAPSIPGRQQPDRL
mmetsp:Transcript_69236/g.150679  ORF Transcript_69236/g.150679 Transcript_69236/m.150679 type:complete len:247 (-) Transcript_69236:210-950(-)